MKIKFFVLAALIATALLAGAATAQDGAGNESDVSIGVDGKDDCAEPETIDRLTQLCDARINEDGTAVLILESKYGQSVMLTDAGDFMAGGEVDQKRVRLQEGRNKVTMRLTTVDGYAGVSIATKRVLYAVPLERQSSIIGGPFDANDVQIAALGGGSSVAFAMIWITFRTLTGKRESPERVA